MACPVEALADVRKRFKPCDAILIGKKDILARVPARGDVVERAGKFWS
jgi:hypothetical protein